MVAPDRLIVLDAGPLSVVTHPGAGERERAASDWLARMLSAGAEIAVPEIAAYEVRRELIRAGRAESVRRLDELARRVRYLPITTDVMRTAAELWAEARNRGRPTAPPEALDCDVILAAQARHAGGAAIIATTNVAHLAQFVDAVEWDEVVTW